MRLAGKRALITAAGQGIGRAAAVAMVAEGARVMATDIDDTALDALAQDAASVALTTCRMDVRSDADVAEVAGQCAPDILFNCAGIVHAGSVLEATDDDWDLALDLNLRSMIRTIRATLPGMLARGAGSIINMSSILSSEAGAPNRAV